jgi:sugar lactone lactonase YvrE
VVRRILFPADVALPATYLNDVRFDLRRGEAGTAFITDSSDSGPNGITPSRGTKRTAQPRSTVDLGRVHQPLI